MVTEEVRAEAERVGLKARLVAMTLGEKQQADSPDERWVYDDDKVTVTYNAAVPRGLGMGTSLLETVKIADDTEVLSYFHGNNAAGLSAECRVFRRGHWLGHLDYLHEMARLKVEAQAKDQRRAAASEYEDRFGDVDDAYLFRSRG